MKILISRQTSAKLSNTKLHENPSSGSRVVACGQKDGWTGMTKPIVVFRNLANAQKKKCKNLTTNRYIWTQKGNKLLIIIPSRPQYQPAAVLVDNT